MDKNIEDLLTDDQLADQIIMLVCKISELSRTEIAIQTRADTYAVPRTVAIYIISDRTGLSYPQIREKFSLTSSAAISKAIKGVKDALANPDSNNKRNKLKIYNQTIAILDGVEVSLTNIQAQTYLKGIKPTPTMEATFNALVERGFDTLGEIQRKTGYTPEIIFEALTQPPEQREKDPKNGVDWPVKVLQNVAKPQ